MQNTSYVTSKSDILRGMLCDTGDLAYIAESQKGAGYI